MTSATAGNAKVGNIWGDLLCMAAQLSFALYLSLFKPLVSVSVSVLVGLAVFKGTQALAALLVFSGVWLVIKSKSKHDIDKHDHSLAYEKRHA